MNSNPYLRLLNNKPNQNLEEDNNFCPPPPIINTNPTINSDLDKKVDEIYKLLQEMNKPKDKIKYYKITPAMYSDVILLEYKDFPPEHVNKIYTDGEKYYVLVANKKIELNKINYLKFMQYINK